MREKENFFRLITRRDSRLVFALYFLSLWICHEKN